MLLVSAFLTPPGFYTRGSSFFAFSYATVTFVNLIALLLFFATPAKSYRILCIIMAVRVACEPRDKAEGKAPADKPGILIHRRDSDPGRRAGQARRGLGRSRKRTRHVHTIQNTKIHTGRLLMLTPSSSHPPPHSCLRTVHLELYGGPNSQVRQGGGGGAADGAGRDAAHAGRVGRGDGGHGAGHGAQRRRVPHHPDADTPRPRRVARTRRQEVLGRRRKVPAAPLLPGAASVRKRHKSHHGPLRGRRGHVRKHPLAVRRGGAP